MEECGYQSIEVSRIMANLEKSFCYQGGKKDLVGGGEDLGEEEVVEVEEEEEEEEEEKKEDEVEGGGPSLI